MPTTQKKNNTLLIVLTLGIVLYLFYKLSSILTPFMLGAIFAYLTDPMVKFLERRKVPHLVAVILAFTVLLSSLILLILILLPIIQAQIYNLIDALPGIIEWIEQRGVPWLKQYINISPSAIKAGLASGLTTQPQAAVTAVLASGYLFFDWIVKLVLTLVVAFYLLRDWDFVCARILAFLPPHIQPTVARLAKQCDAILSVLIRGQFLVMVALAIIYGIGLSLVGLQTGLAIGVLGGLLSIVPYLGSGFVLIVSSLVALTQYATLNALFGVWIVFFIGQAMEGYVLQPYLIGEKIGLHPVIVIFAVLAGGSLFGFFGVLLALPAAAVIKVLLQFVDKKYLHLHDH